MSDDFIVLRCIFKQLENTRRFTHVPTHVAIADKVVDQLGVSVRLGLPLSVHLSAVEAHDWHCGSICGLLNSNHGIVAFAEHK
jgi:hypothetical protein